MRIIIYLGHPAQFHFFKYIIDGLLKNGHQVIILLKTKDILEDLVSKAGFTYVNIQKSIRKNNVFFIAMASFIRTFKVYRIARKYKADMMLGTDASIAQASYLLNIPGITVLEDDVEVIAKLAKISFPFSDSIVVPAVCRVGKWEAKKIPYSGYMKLAYLHPNRFIPDINMIKKYALPEKYCIIRLAQLQAFHDVGVHGLNIKLVLKLIELAKSAGYNIYISSETELDEQLKAYKLKIQYDDIHHIMSFASLLISDSQSMSVEAAMLGLPSIRFSDFSGRISVLDELEQKYGLTYGIRTDNPTKLYEKAKEFFLMPNLKDEFQKRRRMMLKDKIDVTSFFVWLIENYPGSKEILKKDLTYQYRFK